MESVPVVTGELPFVGEADLSWSLEVVLNFADEPEAEPARDASARLVGFVVMNLDMSDIRPLKRRVDQQTRS